MLTRDAILNKVDTQIVIVKVPEWGGDVRVRGMTGEERDAFEGSIVTVKNGKSTVDTKNIRAKLIAHCVVDEKSDPMFSLEDIPALGKKSAAALQRIFDIASKLCGLTEGEVEKIVKNLPPIQSEGSTSD